MVPHLTQPPPFQPPNWAFPVAWSIIYPTLALTSALTIGDLGDDDAGQDHPAERLAYTGILGANLVANAAWPWVFHHRRALATATAVSGVMTLSATALVRRTAKVNGLRGAALSIYPAWGVLATAINSWITRKRS
ncbi:MAG: TspO/MBR family protein [Actinomycetaceae bacterium]|nr:TspO/MBR family protein [Actinomycetaceae bacterium]